MAKNVPATKFTELKGLDRISQIVHEMHCIFRIISQDDFGIDGEIEVVTAKPDGVGFQTSGGIIKVQAKTGASYVKKDSSESFSTPVRKDDLDYWNSCTFPVFFIVYHPGDDALYFKEIKSYIRESPDVFRLPLEVVFRKPADLFSAHSKDAVCQQANVSPPRISFNEQERLYSNLLAVRQLPTTLTFAKTRRTSFQRVKDDIEGYVPPFCIGDKNLYTFSDLRHEGNRLREVCDADAIEDIPVAEWLELDAENRRNLVFMMNQLFGSHCYRCGLKYNPDFGRTYFPRETDDDKDKSFERTWTSPRTKRSDTRTVVQFYEYGAFRFWRHLAAEFSFVQFGANWFLQISPKYLFTKDGKTPCDPALVGPYTTSQKAREHNPQVMNHVLFWADALSCKKPQIEMTLFGESLIVVEKEPLASLAPFAIPLDPATYEEPAPSLQMSLFGFGESEDDA